METGTTLLNQVFDHRLQQGDIRRLLDNLSRSDREAFLDKLSDMLGRVTALLEVSSRLSDSLSLDLLFERLIEVTTTALNVDRGTIFLNDKETNTLFSRVAMGELTQEIRFPNHLGIAGAVFTSGTAVVIQDAYADSRFNREMDKKTGYHTRNILTAPIKNRGGDTVGVIQILNKFSGDFTDADLSLLEGMASQASSALLNAQLYEQVEKARKEEAQLFEVTRAISSELKLNALLQKIMDTVTRILEADRSTLFLHDEKRNELWSVVAQGIQNVEIRFPSHLGIAGKVFTSGELVNIPDAYASPLFNPAVDKKTGYRTESILCVPVKDKEGKVLGVTQVLNKKGGPFTVNDENRLNAFSAQASIAIGNARLFEDVLNMKNYNESILQSLSNCVVTMNADMEVEKCNGAALRVLGLEYDEVGAKHIGEIFSGASRWVAQAVEKVMQTGESDVAMDAALELPDGRSFSVNLNAVPLVDVNGESIGSMLVFEDISGEKRLKGTLARYMTKEVADQLLESDEDLLGGQIKPATILFSDIRGFTTISEQIGAQETVSMLNEYFTVMVDILFHHGGILDKYIGDAILAVFGAPFSTGRDADQAVNTAVDMMRALREFNVGRGAQGRAPIRIGIGINTDEVLVGNIGSLKRMDYTVIGDGVNLASRLEGATKFYGAEILISGFTLKNLAEPRLVRSVDLIKVKGKTKPVAIYEVMDHFDRGAFPQLDEVVGRCEEGFSLYRDMNWNEASECFSRVLRLMPGDKLSGMYVDRCRRLLDNPPTSAWDGVMVMTEK